VSSSSSAASASAAIFPNSILATARIVSQPHPERKSFLINAADLVLSDLPGLAAALKEIYKPSDYRFDRGSSAITAVKAFPENVLFDVWLHYLSDNPRTRSAAIPDERSIPILVKCDFSALKETAYYLGIGIANLIRGLAPEAVIVGGPIVKAWPLISQDIRNTVEATICRGLPSTRIIASTLGPEPTLMGALSLVLASKFASVSVT